ncbi:MAG: glucan biosynthesis protein [Alphaproteobacteria bacterium]
MTKHFSRRSFLSVGATAGLYALGNALLSRAGLAQQTPPPAAPKPVTPPPQALPGLKFGPNKNFSFDLLKAEAKRLAEAKYQNPPPRAADILERIDYDAHQAIRFRRDYSLWATGGGPYPVQFFHLGRYFKQPVKINLVQNNQAREVLYAAQMYDYGKTGFDKELPEDLGFAGFRVMNPGNRTDWIAFLGAAYFRTSGAQDQYGLSARGVAIDVAMAKPEEFPRFTEFWFQPAPNAPNAIIIYCLMDGPSITGAYRMVATKAKGVIMEIEAQMYAREDIQRLGAAPLTSMFWYAENQRNLARDWRPEIHDSDGLAIWNGAGERLWRPLNNPPAVRTSSFLDRNPKGFGLLQRDREFENYQDDGVFYEKRPSVWVEPVGEWGEGAVQLVEIPTDDEIHDNIVAYWVPKEPVKAGSAWSFKYKLHWLADEPYPTPLARVVATRIGIGGVPGQPRPANKKKIAIDFQGGMVGDLPTGAPVKLTIGSARGKVDGAYTTKVQGTKRWRAVFDLQVDGREPVELRGQLVFNDKPISETWLYQFIPYEG